MKINQKKTKIVATIGPSSESQAKLERLLKAGMNVIRMNFSHGDFAEHGAKVENGRAASKKTGLPVAFMQDLAGPEIRTGYFDTDTITLSKGKKVTLTTKKMVGDVTKFYIDYKKLPSEVSVGSLILIDDGKVQLKVESISKAKGEVVCKTLAGGTFKGKRGVNIPGANLSLKSLTAKDKKDLEFAKKYNVDYVAFSFVRSASDVKELRRLLDNLGLQNTGIIPKIETQQAVENIDEIIELSDAVMIARGDLAPEMTYEDVPVVQKMIIHKCNTYGIPVITATQMVESMMIKPIPTRAEVADIANAVLDGTDAIMLSGETALGDYPVEAVETMTRVARKIEDSFETTRVLDDDRSEVSSIGDSITTSAVKTADSIDAKYIISLSYSGHNARTISRHKPEQPIIVMTPKDKTFQKIQLSYGCYPVKVPKFERILNIRKFIRKYLLKEKLAKKGDKIVIVSSLPFGEKHEPNILLVENI